MPLQYAGPKPLISAHGIEFDLNKEDKYVYLSIAAELIRALDHEYVGDKRYSYITSGKPLDDDQIIQTIRHLDPQLDQEIDNRKQIAGQEVDDEITRAMENRFLSEEEKEVLIKNLKLMRNYRIQRAINKTVYYSGVDSIAHIIKQGHIDYITAPMYLKFMHVFHSVQGALGKLHPPIDNRLEIYEKDAHLFVRLDIYNS